MKNRQSFIYGLIGGLLGGAGLIWFLLSSPGFMARFEYDMKTDEGDLGAVTEVEEDMRRTAYEEQIIETVERANPAVVSIVVTKDVPVVERYFEEGGSPFDPFDDFFGGNFGSPFRFRVPQYRQRGTERREVGGGSGFIVSGDGMIVTNRHVVDEDDVEYTVFTNDGTKYDATVVARDPVNDLAVIQIEANELPHLALADSDSLRVGQGVIAIGNALAEFRNTVSVGIVSGLSRSIQAGSVFGQSEQLDEVIQTDAAINPGNSGGPLLNLNGEVIGVNVAVALGSENIGFALPVNLVRGVVQSVEENGTIVRPFLGVRYVPVTPTLAEENRMTIDYGVLVLRGERPEELAVLPGSPAAKAGIQEGDILLEMDETRLDENASLAALVRNKQVGDAVTLKLLRGDEELSLSVTLEALPE